MDQLFPRKVTNNYSGSKIALYAFPIVIVFTVIRSLIHIFASDGGASSIAGITLDEFSKGAADTIIALFALWGISQLLFGLLYGVVFVKYKSLIPLMYVFMLAEYLFRFSLGFFKEVSVDHTPPGVIGNYILIPVFIILLILSLYQKKN